MSYVHNRRIYPAFFLTSCHFLSSEESVCGQISATGRVSVVPERVSHLSILQVRRVVPPTVLVMYNCICMYMYYMYNVYVLSDGGASRAGKNYQHFIFCI